MSDTQRQIVQECFDGDRERDCTYCPAHYTKNGICCFGHKYEDDDAQCMSCPHNYDCSLDTARLERERSVDRPRRIMINRGGYQQPQPQSRLPVYGIEFGSTRIKAILIDEHFAPIAILPDTACLWWQDDVFTSSLDLETE